LLGVMNLGQPSYSVVEKTRDLVLEG